MVRLYCLGALGVLLMVGCSDNDQATAVPEASETSENRIASFKGQCYGDEECPTNTVCYNGLCRLAEAIENPTYHQDIEPLIDQFCAGCHLTGGIGAIPLRSYDDAVTFNELILAELGSDRMPPWTAEEGCADYVNNPRLLPTEKETFKNWVDGGMLKGEELENKKDVIKMGFSLERVDQEVLLEEPYVPVVEGWPEAYRCHTFEWPEDETKFITGFEGVPGHDVSVHHAVYFMSPPGELADHYRALQAEDEEAGFECVGGAFLYDLESTWLGTWAPGRVGSFGEYPEGTGIRIEPGAVVSALVHYDLSYDPTPGKLGFRATLEDEVEREAVVVPWLDIDWVGTDKMKIPAGEAGVTHAHTGDLWGLAEEGAIAIHGSAMHMHTRGTNGTLSIQRADGEEECVLSISDWNRDWQFQHVLTETLEFGPGDQMTISCTWDNLQGKQPTPWMPLMDVYWGDLGLDEMCLGILFVSFPPESPEPTER